MLRSHKTHTHKDELKVIYIGLLIAISMFIPIFIFGSFNKEYKKPINVITLIIPPKNIKDSKNILINLEKALKENNNLDVKSFKSVDVSKRKTSCSDLNEEDKHNLDKFRKNMQTIIDIWTNKTKEYLDNKKIDNKKVKPNIDNKDKINIKIEDKKYPLFLIPEPKSENK